MRVRVYPYDMASDSAKQLAAALEGLRVKPDGNYMPRQKDMIVNWGTGMVPHWEPAALRHGALFLNKPFAVGVASDKIKSYRQFEAQGVPTVEWTTDYEVALAWVAEGYAVLVRTLTRGSGGRGIYLAHPQLTSQREAQQLIQRRRDAPLFVKYTPHSGEYRVHVVNGKIIDFVKKKKMSEEKIEAEGYRFNKFIRNHDNGWVFSREDVILPEGVADTAISAVKALGLDFGAVDVIYSKKRGIFALEVNTAPGLEGQTLVSYTNALKGYQV